MHPRERDITGIPGGRRAAIISSEGTRHSDVAGSEVLADPRVREQLALLMSMYLSEFSMSVRGVGLVLRDDAEDIEREIVIEQDTIGLATEPSQPLVSRRWNDATVATTLLASLRLPVNHVGIDGGHLNMDFGDTVRLRVEPDQHFEAWQIRSRDGLLMVCAPGSDLEVWLPNLTTVLVGHQNADDKNPEDSTDSMNR